MFFLCNKEISILLICTLTCLVNNVKSDINLIKNLKQNDNNNNNNNNNTKQKTVIKENFNKIEQSLNLLDPLENNLNKTVKLQSTYSTSNTLSPPPTPPPSSPSPTSQLLIFSKKLDKNKSQFNTDYRENINISRRYRRELINNNDNELISYNGSVTEHFQHKHHRLLSTTTTTTSTTTDKYSLWSNLNNYTTETYLNESTTTIYYENVFCDETEDENCIIDHNKTCVGEPIYCNLTYDEYMDLLYDYIYPTTPEWILICSHLVVFVMGLVGNALVCIAVYTNHSMRTVTNIFIVNLAVADFFVILFCLPPTVIWDVTETWFMGKAMCKVVLYFQTVSVTVSVLTLTFISIDRWYAICFPLRYVSTNERAIGSIAFIWIVALLGDLPEFLVLTTKKRTLRFGSNLFTQCEATWDKHTEKIFYILKFTILYSLPLLFMSVAYFQIVRVLWKSDTIPGHRESRNQTHICKNKNLRSSCGQTANSSTMGQLRARRKAAKMLVAVVVMFAGCYFPVHVLNILRYTIDIGQNEVITILSLFSHWLCYANSAINPVIYNFMSGKFRREFKNALEKCRCFGSARGRVEDRSLYHSAPGTRTNNISPSSRSNYQLTSVRDITRGQTHQTSFMENGGNGHTNHLNHQQQHHHHHNHHPLTSPMIIDERSIQPTIIDGNT